MYTGIVKNFDIKMGFGFITREDTQDDIFVYVTALICVMTGAKKWRAMCR